MVKRQGYRGLEELAEAAAFLSGEQRYAISKDCHYLKLGDCKEVDDTGGWESPVLRFYGLLTPKQKKDTFTGQVGVLGMTLEQRNALAAAVYSTNFTRVGVYNDDGLNVNEPEVIRGSQGAPAVGVQMTCSGSFTYLQPGDNAESHVLRSFTATTPEEALLAARNQLGREPDPQNIVTNDNIVYTLVVRYGSFDSFADEPIPGFFGSFGKSANASYHRVKIKMPEEKKRAQRERKG